MNYKKLIISGFCLFNSICYCQENIHIQYNDTIIEKLIKISSQLNEEESISIYSVQLQANESLDFITKMKNKFISLFPEEEIIEIFEPPYFKISTGTYLDKKEAEKQLSIIKRNFNSAFVLKREITIDEFKKIQK
ncbi:MAG: hypothetical protein CMP49_01775 [Flavobacteriales bacterium]|nr:hypothetical protein [Flavobacteriales bacterium]